MKWFSASVVTRELQKQAHNELTRGPQQRAAGNSNNKYCFAMCKLGHLHIMGLLNTIDDLKSNLDFLKKLRIITRWTSIFTFNSEENESTPLFGEELAGVILPFHCVTFFFSFWAQGIRCASKCLPCWAVLPGLELMVFLENNRCGTFFSWMLVSVLMWFSRGS